MIHLASSAAFIISAILWCVLRARFPVRSDRLMALLVSEAALNVDVRTELKHPHIAATK